MAMNCVQAQDVVEFITTIGGPKVVVTKLATGNEIVRIGTGRSSSVIAMEAHQDRFHTCEWMDLLGDGHPALVVYSDWGAGSIRSRVFVLTVIGARCLFDFKGRDRVKFFYLTDTNRRAAEVEHEGQLKVWTYIKDASGWNILPQGG